MDAVDKEERLHFQRIVQAFKAYRSHTLKSVGRRELFIDTLPPNQQKMLVSYKEHLCKQKEYISHNAEIIHQIIDGVEGMFENVQHDHVDSDSVQDKNNLDSDIEKVKSTIRQIVRDWSPLGERERSQCYGPIIRTVESLYPANKVEPANVDILVPGAGLGRLAHELAKRGYSCQGNEFSLFMLFTSNFILNKCRGLNTLHVYPWVHSGSNHLSNSHQLVKATFPDADLAALPPLSQFTIAAGDFLEVYTEAGAWDCIATSFFIDCANNVVSFIETIYKILKPGGNWVNLGPLLYHFEEQPGEPSIELSYDDVKNVILGVGFEYIDEKKNVSTCYTQNPHSMMQYQYNSVFFVVRKPM